MPDAMSKTIPIWCAVVNRAALKLKPELASTDEGWNEALYTPPNIVSAQEKSQIEERMARWVDNLLVSRSGITSEPSRVLTLSHAVPEIQLDLAYP